MHLFLGYATDSPVGKLKFIQYSKLEYADDAALIEVGYELASRTVTDLESVALSQADMEISRPKTEYMALRDFVVSAAVQVDFDVQVWAFSCPDCGRGFPTKAGLAIHRGLHCKQRGKVEYELERIVDVRGVPEERFYRVRWVGWGEDDDSWINWRQLDAAASAATIAPPLNCSNYDYLNFGSYKISKKLRGPSYRLET